MIRVIRKILRYEGVLKGSLSFVFVTDQKIKSLNKKYLKHDYATDVLAFDLGRQDSSVSQRVVKLRHAKTLDGEVIISTTAAVKNAGIFKTDPIAEITLYIVHGILHLLGYDDRTAKDIKRMRKKEKELMRILNNRE